MFRGMRRKKQLLSEEETVAILDSCTSGVLAVHGDDGYPYAVPLSFAYEDRTLFFHSAAEGHKIDALERDDKVSFCVIANDDVVQDTFTTHFRSVVAFGRARMLTDVAEKRHGLACLAKKYSPDHLDSADAAIDEDLSRVTVIALAVEHMTGKAAIEIVNSRA